MARPRLGIVVTHPIQYQVPLFRFLAAQSHIEPLVFFLTDHGITHSYDTGFGRPIKYDIPLLDGYRHLFVRNRSPKPGLGTVYGTWNPSLLTILGATRVDALLVHGYNSLSHWLAYGAALRADIPYLVRGESHPDSAGAHPARKFGKRILLGPMLRHAGACLAIGEHNREFYLSYGVPADNIFPAPYSVDTEHFASRGDVGRHRRSEMLASLGLCPELPLVLFAGKLQPSKRPFDVVRAIDRIGSPLNLVIIGDGLLRPDLDAMAAQRPWMRLLGFVNQQEIAAWYGAADLFVLPSDHEPWGLAVNEAMAAGAVPIVSDSVGCGPDLVSEDIGWTFAAGDVNHLARILAEAIQDSSLTSRRMRSRERSRQFGISATASGIESAFDAVLRR